MWAKKRNLLWYTRWVLLMCWLVLTLVLVLPIALIRFKKSANNYLVLKILVPVARKIIGLKVYTHGKNYVDPNTPAVYIMNHQSGLDIFVNKEACHEKTVVIAKRSLALVPLLGWLFYLGGNPLINRKSRSHSFNAMENASKGIQKDKLSIWIFPEGTRSHSKGLGKFKKGAFHLAVDNQVPIIPVVVSSYFKNIDFNKAHAGNVIVEVLPPISTVGLGSEDIDALCKNTEELMKNHVDYLDKKYPRVTRHFASQKSPLSTLSAAPKKLKKSYY